MSVQLGDEVRDKVTGFKGIVMGITEWLYGCRRITVQPKLDKDGKIVDPQAFDEDAIEVIKPKIKKSSNRTGGPAMKLYTPKFSPKRR